MASVIGNVKIANNVYVGPFDFPEGRRRSTLVDDDTFIGMQVLVFKAQVGKNCVVEPGAKLIGVKVADGHYVPAGMVVTTQDQADKLPVITSDYVFKDLNEGMLHVNEQLAEGYLKQEEKGGEK